MIEFFDPWDRTHEELAKRIARMLFDRDDGVFYMEDSGKYQIGAGDNHWLHDRGNGIYRFNHRYFTPETEAAFRVLFVQYLSVRLWENGRPAS